MSLATFTLLLLILLVGTFLWMAVAARGVAKLKSVERPWDVELVERPAAVALGKETTLTFVLIYGGAQPEPAAPEELILESSDRESPISVPWTGVPPRASLAFSPLVAGPITLSVQGGQFFRRSFVLEGVGPAHPSRREPKDAFVSVEAVPNPAALLDAGGWRSEIRVRLVDRDRHERAGVNVLVTLDQPVVVELAPMGGALSTANIEIRAGTSYPDVTPSFRTTVEAGNAIRVSAISPDIDHDREVKIACETTPNFECTAAPNSVPADGHSESTIVVRALDPAGQPIAVRRRVDVVMTQSLSPAADLSPTVLTFDPGDQVRRASLSSFTHGQSVVSFKPTSFIARPSTVSVEFRWPMGNLLWCLFGSLVGTLLVLALNIDGPPPETKKMVLRRADIRVFVGAASAFFLWLYGRHGLGPLVPSGQPLRGELADGAACLLGGFAGLTPNTVIGSLVRWFSPKGDASA